MVKNSIYKVIGRYTRTRIFWHWEIFNFIKKNKLLAIRGNSESIIANNFYFYWENLDNKTKKDIRNILIKNTDELSAESVDNFIKRQSYIATHNILEQRYLFTKLEIEQQKECSKIIKNISKKMSSYYFSYLASECFYGLSGLRWIPENIKQKINNGIIIDAGACEGDTTIYFKEVFKPQKIYAFEPDNKNYDILKKNCKISNDNTIIPIKLGLASKNEKTYLISNGPESKQSTNSKDQELELINFDDFWEKENKSNNTVSLIKMDVEGAEINALKGMEKTIKKDMPILAISIYHQPKDFFTIKPWLETICPKYKFLIRKASPFSLTTEIMLLAYIEE